MLSFLVRLKRSSLLLPPSHMGLEQDLLCSTLSSLSCMSLFFSLVVPGRQLSWLSVSVLARVLPVKLYFLAFRTPGLSILVTPGY